MGEGNGREEVGSFTMILVIEDDLRALRDALNDYTSHSPDGERLSDLIELLGDFLEEYLA